MPPLTRREKPPAIPRQADTDDEMVALWLDHYRSANTRQAYAFDIRLFRGHCAKPLAKVTVRDLHAFSARLTNFTPATTARRLSAVKSLFSFAHRLGYLPYDVATVIQLPGIKSTLAERILSEEQVQRLLWAADSMRGTYRRRNAALLRLLYGAGLRVSEACELRWRDLVAREDAGQITVFGKGEKSRVVLLPATLFQRVSALRGNSGPDGPVFRTRGGQPIDRHQAGRVMKQVAKRARLPDWISPHCLRHSHASHALDRGCPVHVVQTTLGHASLTTTTLYSHARPGDSSAKYLQN